MRIVRYNQAGEIISDVGTPDQAKAVEIEPEEIDLKTLTNEDFQRIVLEKLGMKVKK